MIYKAIWLVLQICFTIYNTLRQICCRMQSSLRSYDQERRKKEEQFLKSCSNELSKVPNHLSIIIGPEESGVPEELFLRLIKYAIWTKIDFISIYDTRKGNRHCDLIDLELPKDVHVKQLGERHLLWTIDKSRSETISHVNTNSNGYKNGFKFNNSIEIFKIESFQSHAIIGDVCRDLFKQRQFTEMKEALQKQTLLTQQIENELVKRLWKCKDPELCIVFSKYMCTFGMLPWHMRFTEFHLYEHGSFFDATAFAKILYRYARCEQRWGK